MGSHLSLYMGRLSDQFGARPVATLGNLVLIGATVIYLSLGVATPLWVVLVASAVSGIGSAMFYPANSSAVMANARIESYGTMSGILRTVQNIGILGSFILAISVAAAAIPRSVAFEVFIGTTNLVGGVSEMFLAGIHSALMVSIALMGIAGVMSWMRGTEQRGMDERSR